MAKFICQVRSSYGKKGEVVTLDGVKELTPRQAQLLKPYSESSEKKVDGKKLEVATPSKSDAKADDKKQGAKAES